MKRRAFLLGSLLVAALGLPSAVRADNDLVVVVAASSRVEHLSRTEVTHIFLGRFKKLPDGTKALPIDVKPWRAAFYETLVGKSEAEINAYWARLTFSGQTVPPRQESPADALQLVATVPGAITYVERRDVDKRVRVVLELSR